MRKILFVLPLIFLILMSCSKKPEDKIVGYWAKMDSKDYSIAFYKNKTVLVDPVKGEPQKIVNYRFIDDKTVEIKTPLKSILLKITFPDKNTMKMKLVGDSSIATLKRVSESQFEKVAENVAKKIYETKLKSKLMSCQTELESKYAEYGEYEPVNCDAGSDIVTITNQDGKYYFLDDDELSQEHTFNNGIVTVVCIFKGFKIECK